MNTQHTKSVMKHNHWMIHTITYNGIRGTLGKMDQEKTLQMHRRI